MASMRVVSAETVKMASFSTLTTRFSAISALSPRSWGFAWRIYKANKKKMDKRAAFCLSFSSVLLFLSLSHPLSLFLSLFLSPTFCLKIFKSGSLYLDNVGLADHGNGLALVRNHNAPRRVPAKVMEKKRSWCAQSMRKKRKLYIYIIFSSSIPEPPKDVLVEIALGGSVGRHSLHFRDRMSQKLLDGFILVTHLRSNEETGKIEKINVPGNHTSFVN